MAQLALDLKVRAGFALVALSLAGLLPGPTALVAQERAAHPLDELRNRTGWIVIGVVDLRQYDDMLAEQPHFARVNGLEEHRFRIPRIGDLVRVLSAREEILIRDFGSKGERERLKAPLLGPALKGEGTGVFLPQGTIVRVVALARQEPLQDLQNVLARVESPRSAPSR